MPAQFIPRENYWKYKKVKNQLLKSLQVEQSAKDIAENIGISVPTFHKYKNFLQIETEQQYITRDERIFQGKLQSEAEIAKTANTPEGTATPPATAKPLPPTESKTAKAPETSTHLTIPETTQPMPPVESKTVKALTAPAAPATSATPAAQTPPATAKPLSPTKPAMEQNATEPPKNPPSPSPRPKVKPEQPSTKQPSATALQAPSAKEKK